MTVSPMIPEPSVPPPPATATAKSKGLVVAKGLNQGSDGLPPSGAHSEFELSEQLDEDVKRKYVKGILGPGKRTLKTIKSSWLMDLERQEARRGNLCDRLSRSPPNGSVVSCRN